MGGPIGEIIWQMHFKGFVVVLGMVWIQRNFSWRVLFRLNYLLLSSICIAGCAKHSYTGGYYSPASFVHAAPWKTKVNTSYKPQADAITALAKADSFELRVFMGMWCHDSQRLVPRLLSLQEKLPIRKFEIVALDTTRRDPQGLAAAAGVRALPVVQVLRNGKELGRIVEKPKTRLELDLQKLTTKR